MIREKRPGYKKDTWFLPGGRMDKPGDTPRKAAIREMREESGYRPKEIRQLYKKSPSSSLIWDIYIFAARDLVFDPLPKDKGEVIQTHFIPFKKAVIMALDGTIDNEFIAYSIIRFDFMLKHGQFKW
jgi:ADP-ribose pyrophosphatase